MTLLCSLQVHQSSGTIPFSGNIPTVWVKSPFNIVFFLNLQYSLCISPFHIHVGLTCMPMITSMVTLSSILFQFSAVFLPLCIASHAMRMANFKSSGQGSGRVVVLPDLLWKHAPLFMKCQGLGLRNKTLLSKSDLVQFTLHFVKNLQQIYERSRL